ncbi:MAG: nitroreductase family protein [Solirubrobacterales bacterium]
METLMTRRSKEQGKVRIDDAVCNGCGLCVKVCSGETLHLENDRVKVDQSRMWGCIACGQCMAVCPKECIFVTGREMTPADRIPLPPREAAATYEQLNNLMLRRRSIRSYKKKEVEPEVIQKILDAAVTAPMGLPPSEVEVTVFAGFDKVSEWADDLIALFQKQKWLFKPPVLWLWRIYGKEMYGLMKSFIAPLADLFADRRREGEDVLFYGAPLAMYFSSSPTSDPADALIPATYAMLAGESLGLGSCMIGTVGPMLKYKSKVTEKYGITTGNHPGVAIIFGYPELKYHSAIRRTFASVKIHKA